MKTIEVTAAIVRSKGQILICQRPVHKNCGLLWEFPGGKIEAGETGEQCIIRECQEELGITLSVKQKLTDITYEYPDRIVHLHFFLCDILSGILEKKEHNAIAWINSLGVRLTTAELLKNYFYNKDNVQEYERSLGGFRVL